MAGHLTKAAMVTTFSAVFAVVACSGESDEVTSATDVTIELETPTASDAPRTTTATDAVKELERDQQVNEFLDAAEANANCSSFECGTAQATYDRHLSLYELASEIPGDDVLPYFSEISSAWDAWNDCLSAAESRFERFDCAEESDMEQVITDLYDALSE